MSPERWKQVKQILNATLDEPAPARRGYLEQACAGDEELFEEVKSLLLASEEADSFLETPAPVAIASQVRLGPYLITEEIGHGGMGTVYRAVRDDDQYQQEVAIKLVRPGMDTAFVRDRFRFERQVLAFLNHPNIARLLDGGTTEDGLPYFVMELVSGKPIVDYCRDGDLSVRDRLRLFLRVCAAVSFAHRNLIIHRDLKPSNVLVTADGDPKLLDFGIAKILLPDHDSSTTQTAAASRMMTPDYASPEQARGQPMNVATDIYSLGAILYELLTGRKAHRFENSTPAEVERVICTVDPPLPSSFAGRAVRGDLDNIIMKALDKDPARRYTSVEQFAEDITRHLENLPVLAHQATFRYRFGRFVSRNRTAAVAGLLVILTTAGGVFATLYQAHLARRERDRAERRFNEVRSLANAVIFEVDAAFTNQGPMAARELLAQRALAYLDRLATEVQDNSALAVELANAYEHLANVQGRPDTSNLGRTADALASYRKALVIREAEQRQRPNDPSVLKPLAMTYQRISSINRVMGRTQEALDYDRKALALRQRLLETAPDNVEYQRLVASSNTTLAAILTELGDWQGVLGARQGAYRIYAALSKSNQPADLANFSFASLRLAGILLKLGQREEAFQRYREAIAIDEQLARREPQNVNRQLALAASQYGLASAYFDSNRNQAALDLTLKAIDIRLQILQNDPMDWRTEALLAISYHRVGEIHRNLGHLPEARAYLQRGLDIRERLSAFDPNSSGIRADVAQSYLGLGTVAEMTNRSQAIGYYRKADNIYREMDAQKQLSAAAHSLWRETRERLEKLKAPAP
jgi:non-specific serine/threonine protein kinase/serine/threonine-protein kinase